MKVRPAAVIVKDNKVLLMRYHYNGKDVFSVPGGGPENTEDLHQTLVREFDEELQIQIRPDAMILSGTTIKDDKVTLHLIFSADLLDGTPRLNPLHTTALEVVWKPISELSSLTMYPNIGSELGTFLQNQEKGSYIGNIDQPWA